MIGSDFERGLAHRMFWGDNPTHNDNLLPDEHIYGKQPDRASTAYLISSKPLARCA